MVASFIPILDNNRKTVIAITATGIEADGFHTTDTVDYVMVLEGEVSLELDTGEVALRPGDCVVQRQTRHAWRNRSATPVRMVAVMVSLRPSSPA